MINMGDFLGHLLSEVTKARVQADMETLTIAKIYASDPLLKHFPVPRIRLTKVEINVPVIISETPTEEDKLIPKIDSKTVISEAEKITEKELSEVLNLKLSVEDTGKLHTALSNKTAEIDNMLKTGATKEAIAKKMANEIIETCKQLDSFRRTRIEDIGKLKVLEENIKTKLSTALINLEKKPEYIRVIPLTSKIREIGNIENVVTLKLSLIEDAVEWSVIDKGDGKTEEILVPE